MNYQLAHHSLQGARRYNEDRVAVLERHNAVLLAVADGLGGHQGGALAAQMAIDVTTQAFLAVRQPRIVKPSAFLALTLLKAHKAIMALGRAQRPALEPRTTAVLCLVQDGYAYWAHVGDSRLYHFRGGALRARTYDDTAIEQFRRDGMLTEEEMLTHPDKSRLLKCLGGTQRPSISLGRETALQRGDVLLLCSDGLWEAFSPEEMGRRLARAPLEDALVGLLGDAEDKMRQGCDNVSGACLRWEDGVTSALPLEAQAGPRAFAADTSSLLRNGARSAARKRTPTADDTSVERTLAEIESFIKRFENK